MLKLLRDHNINISVTILLWLWLYLCRSSTIFAFRSLGSNSSCEDTWEFNGNRRRRFFNISEMFKEKVAVIKIIFVFAVKIIIVI